MAGRQTLLASSVLVLLSLSIRTDALAQSRERCRAPFQVGFRIVDVPGGPKTAVWYPTSAKESSYAYSKELSGSVAVDGPPLNCGRFPLVVFSHGLAGCGIQSVFFTEQLPRAGYVVAAPDHSDALCSVGGAAPLRKQQQHAEQSVLKPETWTQSTYANRRADLEATIDWITRSGEFSRMVDADRIGAVGHSIGGYTILGMAGAWPAWKDPRLKAIVLFSPYAHPFLVQKRLASVNVPVMYQGAQLDLGVTPFLKGPQGAFAAGRDAKFFVELRGGNHFEWTNALCFGLNHVQDCLARRPNARLIVLYGAAFLDRYLKGDQSGLRRLKGSGLAAIQRGGN